MCNCSIIQVFICFYYATELMIAEEIDVFDNCKWIWSLCFHSIRVSNELGGGNPEAASLAVRVVLSIAFIEGVLLVSAMILLRHVWGHVYSNDKQVIRYVSVMMPILAISSFLDGIQSALSGIPHSYLMSYFIHIQISAT